MNVIRRGLSIALGTLLLSAATLGAAQPDPRIERGSGRDLARWPPSPQFQYKHMRLAIDIPDMNAPMFSGSQTLTVSPVGSARAAIRLDAGPGISVKAVRAGGRPAAYTHEKSVLTVRFNAPLPAGRDVDIAIDYDCDLKANHGRGLTWSAANATDPRGETFQAPQLHSQGEAQENHRWFPCHDFPNVKLTTELIVTVEEGFEVSSNGRLVSKRSRPGGRVSWHWLQDKPHTSYLVTLVVGKLAIVDVNPADGDADSPRPGLPMRVYTPIGTEDTVRANFADTAAMVAYFEKKFDEPYPWVKYDQVIVRDFAWGGMENTSATTLYLPASMGSPEMHTDLISHELAHQWFGDLVTCKTWEHIWLNEGWASIAEALWVEQEANLKAAGITRRAAAEVAPPTEEGRRAYQKRVLGFMQSQRGGNRGYLPVYPAMASRYYNQPDESIMKIDDVYAKGALVLHMLRVGLGDDTFFAGTRLYLDRFKFKCAETDDFRRCMEEASGKSLERFFAQWVYRPGLPRLDVDLDHDGAALQVTVEQTQRIDIDNPAYEFTLPLLLRFDDGTHRYEYVQVNGRRTTASFNVPRPAQVSVDPNLTVVAGTSVRKPLAMWIDELKKPPTLAAEIRAVEHLGRTTFGQAWQTLSSAALDPGRDPAVRDAAVAACNSEFLRQRLTNLPTKAAAVAAALSPTARPSRVARN